MDCRTKELAFDDILSGPIRDVFLKHDCEAQFCVQLQHAHHLVGEDEAMVKVAGTAHRMDNETLQAIKALGNQIAATSWMSSGAGGFLPMEFSVLDSL